MGFSAQLDSRFREERSRDPSREPGTTSEFDGALGNANTSSSGAPKMKKDEAVQAVTEIKDGQNCDYDVIEYFLWQEKVASGRRGKNSTSILGSYLLLSPKNTYRHIPIGI